MPLICPYQNPDDPTYKEARASVTFSASTIPDLLGVGYISAQKRILYDRGDEEFAPNQYVKDIMQRGKDYEPIAAQALEKEWFEDAGCSFAETGFWSCPAYPSLIGATPDRLMLDRDLNLWSVEIKVPLNPHEISVFDMKWLRYRIQLEVQMRCVDACVKGILFIYNVNDPDNSQLWECLPDDELWDLIVKKAKYWKTYRDDAVGAPLPKTIRGTKMEEIMEWAEKKKKGKDEALVNSMNKFHF